MINIQDGELLDLLPAQLKYNTDMICLSHALKIGVQKLLEYEKATMTVNFIDYLPEKILDVLAIEMRSPYYSDSMDIETKRAVIKSTYTWHFKAGTVSAVSEMVATVFGEGSVVEWWDFTEGEKTPYMFDIETNAQLTPDIYDIIVSIIERVINVRSHLRRIKIDRDINMYEYVATGAIASPKIPVNNTMDPRERAVEGMQNYAAAATASPYIRLDNALQAKDEDITHPEYAAIGAMSAPKIMIGNNMGNASSDIEQTIRYAAAAMSNPKITIN